jgi:hypothetical protein
MDYSNVLNQIKVNGLNLSDTFLDKRNPYIGTFPWYWQYMIFEPKYKEAQTQTEPDLYRKLGETVALKYGKDWKSLLDDS